MTDDYEIPTGDTGHEPGTFLMTLVSLTPFKLYQTRAGWSRQQPEGGPAAILDAFDKIEWAFSDDTGEIGKDSTSVSRSERSTLFAWATGLGVPAAVVLDRSKPIPSSQLIGREAMVTFAPNANGYSRITAVVPPPKARAAVPAAVDQPMTTLPNQVQPGEFSGAPAPQPVAPAGDLPF